MADETVLKIDGQNVWLWDIIDEKTRFLLATRLSTSRTTRDAQMLMDRAIKKAGKAPKVVITDKLASYLDVNYGKGAEHEQGGPFSFDTSTSLIERFHGTFKDRTKVMRGLKNLESAHEFTDGWLVHYNYFRPHSAIGNQTPAEVAGIERPFKNWAEVVRSDMPKIQAPMLSQLPDIPRAHIRITEHAPRISPRTPRISQPAPRLSHNVYERGGLMSRRYMGKGSHMVDLGMGIVRTRRGRHLRLY